MLSNSQKLFKRSFDILFAFTGLIICFIPLFLLLILASFDTKKFGLFKQKRIGFLGKLFDIYKIRTIKGIDTEDVYISKNSKNISKFGRFLRKYHLDELPQLYNILMGDMSFVGPRPDLVGYADKLQLKDQLFLQVKPGITSPASLKYRGENKLLSQQKKPKEYYKNVLWPEKVKMNNDYVKNWSFFWDIKLIWLTIFN
jgi:lipopolysaccharide/colanic/teichoic acid biosynthesis glycosyltransferase